LVLTVLVYGAVALLVKTDDFGLRLAETGQLEATRTFGRGLVAAMPTVLSVITVIGTAAMLWVGGSIVIHGLHQLHFSWPYNSIKALADLVSGNAAVTGGAWLVTALLDAIVGFVLGTLLIPLVERVILPIGVIFPEKK
jgi:predicted DNA repair protein MutK